MRNEREIVMALAEADDNSVDHKRTKVLVELLLDVRSLLKQIADDPQTPRS